jgi:uncharacterized delta-60 repeat protein
MAGQAHDVNNRLEVLVARLDTDGSLDPSFGSGGFILHQFGGGATPSSEAQGVLVQPDGKILISGQATDSNGRQEAMVARLNPGGSLDSTFGTGGAVLSQQGVGTQPRSRVNFESIVLQGGKIVVGGEATDTHNQTQLMVIRLNPDGTFDSSFGSGGVFLDQLGFGTSPRSRVTSIALQSDGKILAAGDGEPGAGGGGEDIVVVRLNGTDGSLDSSFGSGGIVETNLGSGPTPFSGLFPVTALADGKLIVGGSLTNASGKEVALVARLNPGGGFDSSFGSGGVSTMQFGETNPMIPNTPSGYVFSMAVQPNGRIVAGLNISGTGTDFDESSKIARFNADGTLDTSFGTGGVAVPVQLPAGPTSFADQDGMALEPDGKILVGGDDSNGGGDAFVTRIIGDPVPTPSIGASPNPAGVGQAVSFTGSSGGDPNGAIPSYSWNFGDGANGTGANAQHAYAKPGSYKVTLTVNYDDGVIASASKTVAVPAVQLTGVSQSHRRWREGHALPHIARVRKPPIGTTFRFKLNQSAAVRFAFTQKLPGRKVGHRCVAPSKKNQHKPRCARLVTRGALSFRVGAGAHKVRFDGRLSKHKTLRPGRYTVVITARSGSGPPATKKLTFTIVKG